jgi:hypothetical protein
VIRQHRINLHHELIAKAALGSAAKVASLSGPVASLSSLTKPTMPSKPTLAVSPSACAATGAVMAIAAAK